MKLRKAPWWLRQARRRAQTAIDWLYNNNLPDSARNGEHHLLSQLMSSYEPSETLVAFDVGANRGDYTDTFLRFARSADRMATIHAFEPLAACILQLEKRFADRSNFKLVPAALSDDESEATMFSDAEASTLSSLYKRDLEAYGIQLGISESVKLLRADTYISSIDLQHLHLAKIDVEGHELRVLSGFGIYLNPEFIDCIQFEYGGANIDSKSTLRELLGLLAANGFLTAKLMRTGLEQCTWHPRLENYQYANYVAVSPLAFPQS